MKKLNCHVLSASLFLVVLSIFLFPRYVLAVDESSDYKEQFDFYVSGATRAGLIPNFKGNLDEFISESDVIDFIFQFLIDINGKYSGGASGNKRTDDFVAEILDKIIKPGMTDNQKVKTIYDYMIYNFEHDSNAAPVFSSGNRNNANPLSSTVSWAMPILVAGKGTCDVFANTFRLIAIRLGYETNFVSGQYINRDGSRHGHGWNQIKVGGEWYWLDVDVEGTVFRREKTSVPSYFLFMKKDKDWVSNHQWNRSDWPAADDTKHSMSLSWYDEPGTTIASSEPSITEKAPIDGTPVEPAASSEIPAKTGEIDNEIENEPAYSASASSTDYSSDNPDNRSDVYGENFIDVDRKQDRFETFTLPDRKKITQVGDMRLQLTKTNVKKSQFNIKIFIDGDTIEKKDQKVNEVMQIFDGKDRVRYEVFINWVRKDSAGGYLRINNSD